jgi:hypothetical protein
MRHVSSEGGLIFLRALSGAPLVIPRSAPFRAPPARFPSLQRRFCDPERCRSTFSGSIFCCVRVLKPRRARQWVASSVPYQGVSPANLRRSGLFGLVFSAESPRSPTDSSRSAFPRACVRGAQGGKEERSLSRAHCGVCTLMPLLSAPCAGHLKLVAEGGCDGPSHPPPSPRAAGLGRGRVLFDAANRVLARARCESVCRFVDLLLGAFNPLPLCL